MRVYWWFISCGENKDLMIDWDWFLTSSLCWWMAGDSVVVVGRWPFHLLSSVGRLSCIVNSILPRSRGWITNDNPMIKEDQTKYQKHLLGYQELRCPEVNQQKIDEKKWETRCRRNCVHDASSQNVVFVVVVCERPPVFPRKLITQRQGVGINYWGWDLIII